MFIRRCWSFLVLLFAFSAHAQLTSHHTAHPVAWMYFLPTGETPGWKHEQWINLELSQSNVYNRSAQFTNLRTGKTIQYEADFEQTSFIMEGGYSPMKDLMVAFEMPVAYRGGGIFDNFIDEFHQKIQSDRFLRHTVAARRTEFSMRTDGEDRLNTTYFSGLLSTMKSKMKYRLIPWEDEYGLSVSTQLKTSVGPRTGFVSGGFDMSFLIHAGALLWQHSGIWFTAGYTKISPNNIFYDWSNRDWLQMYELTLDLALTDHWGLLGFLRMESPLMNVGDFEFQHTETSSKKQIEERVASGWNSLMYWRGTQGMGARYRWTEGDQMNFLFIEDWGVGGYDRRSSNLYVNNAPDIAFVLQLHYAL